MSQVKQVVLRLTEKKSKQKDKKYLFIFVSQLLTMTDGVTQSKSFHMEHVCTCVYFCLSCFLPVLS